MNCNKCGHNYCICHSLSRYESNTMPEECTICSETSCDISNTTDNTTILIENDSCVTCSQTPCSCSMCKDSCTIYSQTPCSCSVCNKDSCNTCSQIPCLCSVCNKDSCNICSQTPCSCSGYNKDSCDVCSQSPCTCSACMVSELGEVISDCSEKKEDNVLQNDAPVFVYQDGFIVTNTNRGIDNNTPLLLGNYKINRKLHCNPTLIVDGDVYISGNIYSNNNNDNNNDNNASSQCEPINNTYLIKSSDNIDILYVNSSSHPIVVLFDIGSHFKPNYKITIKDVSINSSYNVYIKIMQHKNQVQLQHYVTVDDITQLVNSYDGIYVLNTSGGAVTYRYYKSPTTQTFVIESEFVGNERKTPGLTFG